MKQDKVCREVPVDNNEQPCCSRPLPKVVLFLAMAWLFIISFGLPYQIYSLNSRLDMLEQQQQIDECHAPVVQESIRMVWGDQHPMLERWDACKK